MCVFMHVRLTLCALFFPEGGGSPSRAFRSGHGHGAGGDIRRPMQQAAESKVAVLANKAEPHHFKAISTSTSPLPGSSDKGQLQSTCKEMQAAITTQTQSSKVLTQSICTPETITKAGQVSFHDHDCHISSQQSGQYGATPVGEPTEGNSTKKTFQEECCDGKVKPFSATPVTMKNQDSSATELKEPKAMTDSTKLSRP